MEPRSRFGPFRTRRDAVAGIAIALITAGLYLAWLGWDQDYEVDPVTGALSGPYETWQVVGVVACLGLVALVAGALGLHLSPAPPGRLSLVFRSTSTPSGMPRRPGAGEAFSVAALPGGQKLRALAASLLPCCRAQGYRPRSLFGLVPPPETGAAVEPMVRRARVRA